MVRAVLLSENRKFRLVMPERAMLLIWTTSSLDGEMGRFYWI